MNCTNCNNPLPDGAKFCVKCGQKTNSQTESAPEQKTGKKSVLGGAISVIVFILAFAGVRYLTSETISPSVNSTTQSGYSKSELITQTVNELKSSMALPAQIDEATTLVDVTTQPNAIRYHCTLSGVDTSSLSNNYLKCYLGPILCQDQDIRRYLLDQDIGMEYSYIVENSTQSYFVSFTKTDCL